MLKARLTEEPDGRVALESIYHGALVDWLRTLPSGSREWSPDRRRWIISAMYAEELLAALAAFCFQVQDDRAALAPGHDDAAVWAPSGMPRDLAEAFHSLGLCGSAPLELAEHTWKWWLRYYHPDVNGTGEDAAAKQLNDAIATIRHYLKGENAP